MYSLIISIKNHWDQPLLCGSHHCFGSLISMKTPKPWPPQRGLNVTELPQAVSPRPSFHSIQKYPPELSASTSTPISLYKFKWQSTGVGNQDTLLLLSLRKKQCLQHPTIKSMHYSYLTTSFAEEDIGHLFICNADFLFLITLFFPKINFFIE